MQILSKNMTEGQEEFKKPVKIEKSPTSPQGMLAIRLMNSRMNEQYCSTACNIVILRTFVKNTVIMID